MNYQRIAPNGVLVSLSQIGAIYGFVPLTAMSPDSAWGHDEGAQFPLVPHAFRCKKNQPWQSLQIVNANPALSKIRQPPLSSLLLEIAQTQEEADMMTNPPNPQQLYQPAPIKAAMEINGLNLTYAGGATVLATMYLDPGFVRGCLELSLQNAAGAPCAFELSIEDDYGAWVFSDVIPAGATIDYELAIGSEAPPAIVSNATSTIQLVSPVMISIPRRILANGGLSVVATITTNAGALSANGTLLEF
jgi:hypothetical protein